MGWVVAATILLAIIFIRYYQIKLDKTKKQSHRELLKVANLYKCRLLEEAIHQCLVQMDKTNGFYVDEDSANKELTTCLNLLGHNARYHHKLDNGREADIFVDNCIVEGKLEPEHAEIDRLIGQVADYLVTSYRIFIVLYGHIDNGLLDRLNNQLILTNQPRVKLIYLNKAQRARRT